MMGFVYKARGFTLVELIIAIVIMAIALVSLSMTVSFSARHSSDSMIQVKLVELGQAYLEEILTKRFNESTPIGGIPACFPAGVACGALGAESENRADFDDVDDYAGLDESPPRDSLGNIRSNYVGYRVVIDVVYMSVAEQAAYTLDDMTDGKLITATVYPPSGKAIVFSAYKANF